MTAPSSDVAFTPSVKAAQTAHGSRASFARMEAGGGFRTGITPELVDALAGIDTAYLATASASGQPYASIAAARRASSACSRQICWVSPTT